MVISREGERDGPQFDRLPPLRVFGIPGANYHLSFWGLVEGIACRW
jgi:hypothetical protein